MRKICVVTGTRAEYGLLSQLLRALEDSRKLDLQLIATAMHLSPEFGETYKEIEADGFTIDAKVEMLLSSDSATAIAKSLGLGVIGLSDALRRLAPDFVLLLGDRFEALAAAQTAMLLKIPIVHLHGGETTEGAVDEAMRHSISKMSHLHFVSTDVYRKRVIQLGENPERVFNVGALGVENALTIKLLSRSDLEEALGFSLGDRYFLVTYHPATLGSGSPAHAMQELLKALDAFPNAKIVFTYPNADTHGRQLIPMIESYAAENASRVLVARSLGSLKYLSALKYSSAVIGNSSSGIIEAPSLRVPTVNVGIRQQGRVQAESVVNCDEDHASIEAAIRKTLDDAFRVKIGSCTNPYGQGDTSRKIISILESVHAEGILIKKFHDLNAPEP